MNLFTTSVGSIIVVATGGQFSAAVLVLAAVVFMGWVLQTGPRTARAVSIIRAWRRPGRRP